MRGFDLIPTSVCKLSIKKKKLHERCPTDLSHLLHWNVVEFLVNAILEFFTYFTKCVKQIDFSFITRYQIEMLFQLLCMRSSPMLRYFFCCSYFLWKRAFFLYFIGLSFENWRARCLFWLSAGFQIWVDFGS